MRLSRLEKNNKAIEENIYRDKYNRIKMKKTGDRETYSKFLKGPSQFILDRSNSNFEMIKKGNSYSITKISTTTINNQGDTREMIMNNANSRLAAKSNLSQVPDGYIVNVVRKDQKETNMAKKALTNSTTADIHSNCSDNSNNQCRISLGFVERKDINSDNSKKSIKEIDTKSREFDIAHEKISSPHSESVPVKLLEVNNEKVEIPSKANLSVPQPISEKKTIINNNMMETDSRANDINTTLCERFDRVVSDFTSKIEYIKKTSTLDMQVHEDLKVNCPVPKEEKCLKNKCLSGKANNNSNLPDETDCLCRICCNGEISEAYLANQIYHIIYDIYDCHIKNEKISETIQKYKKLVYGFCTIEDKKEIVFFVKLFDDKVKGAFKEIKKSIFHKQEFAKFKEEFENVIDEIESRFKNNDWNSVFSKEKEIFDKELQEFESDPVKFIINKVYKEHWDGIIFSIFSDIFHAYKSLIEASEAISIVFSPGIEKIELFTSQQIFLEDFHKEVFDNVFLKDNFIKNIIEVLKKRNSNNENNLIKKMVEQIELDLDRPHPESDKIASIIEKGKDLLKEYYSANFDEGVFEEDYDEEEEVEVEEEVEAEEENETREEDVQQFTEQEIYEYINSKQILYNKSQYKTPSKIVNYKNRYFKFINGESQKKNDEEENDSNYNEQEEVEEVEDAENNDDNEDLYIKSRGYYSSTDKYRFKIKTNKVKQNAKETINIQLAHYNVDEDNLHNYIENLDEDQLNIPMSKRLENKLRSQRLEHKHDKSDEADYSDNQNAEEEVSYHVVKNKFNNRYQRNHKCKASTGKAENTLLEQVKYSYELDENGKKKINAKNQYIMSLEEQLREELAKPVQNGKISINHKKLNKSNYKEAFNHTCHKKEIVLNIRPEQAQEQMLREDGTEQLANKNSEVEVNNKNSYIITNIPLNKAQSSAANNLRKNNGETTSCRKKDTSKFNPNDTANPNLDLDELVRIIDQTGASNTKKAKNALKKQKKEKEKEKEKTTTVVVSNQINRAQIKGSNKKTAKPKSPQKSIANFEEISQTNTIIIQSKERENDEDSSFIQKFKNCLQMSTIHRNFVWKEQSCIDKF